MAQEKLEAYWDTLRGRSRLDRFKKKAREASVGFFDYVFTWVGRAWEAVWRTILGEGFIRLFLILAGSFVVLYLGLKLCTADGKVDYCRLIWDAHDSKFRLEGHRAWRYDSMLMDDSDREVLIKAAHDYHCEIH